MIQINILTTHYWQVVNIVSTIRRWNNIRPFELNLTLTYSLFHQVARWYVHWFSIPTQRKIQVECMIVFVLKLYHLNEWWRVRVKSVNIISGRWDILHLWFSHWNEIKAVNFLCSTCLKEAIYKYAYIFIWILGLWRLLFEACSWDSNF